MKFFPKKGFSDVQLRVNSTYIPIYVGHYVLVNLIFWVIKYFDWWRYWGFVPMKPDFADLRAFTAQVTCVQRGIDLLTTNCDPWDREIGSLNIYVPLLRFLHISESRTGLVGNLFQIFFFLSLYVLAFRLKLDLSKLKNMIFLLLALISPPVAIAIERGQFELVLLVGLVSVAFLLNRNKINFAFLILGFLAVLKIYPIFILFLSVINRSIKKSRIQMYFGFFVISISAIIIFRGISGSMGTLQDNALSTGFWRTFGVTVLPYLGTKFLRDLNVLDSDFTLSLVQAHLVGMFFVLILVATFFLLLVRGKVFGPNLSGVIKSKSLGSMVILLSLSMTSVCYFLVSSYDYRMIYLLPLFLVILAEPIENREKGNFSYLASWIVITMWSQAFIWTSAISQIPLLITLILLLFNIGPILQSQYASPSWLKKFIKLK